MRFPREGEHGMMPFGSKGAFGVDNVLESKIREQQEALQRSLPEEDAPVSLPPNKRGRWQTFRRRLIRLGVLSPLEDGL